MPLPNGRDLTLFSIEAQDCANKITYFQFLAKDSTDSRVTEAYNLMVKEYETKLTKELNRFYKAFITEHALVEETKKINSPQ